ncbi:MAG: hypothetical protein QXE91_00005 [Thermofilaceae archaeon]
MKGEKLYIGACGRVFFAMLRGCTEELKVSVKLSYIAEALEAFEIAWLVPGKHSVHARGVARSLSPAEGRVAEGLHTRSPRVTFPIAIFPIFS